MMSHTASAAWSRPILSLCYTKHGPSRDGVLLGHITTIAACISACASVMHERALETCEPSCVPRAAKPFFNPVVHSPPGAMGHVAALELPFQESRAPSCGTRGSTGSYLSKEAKSGAVGHMAAPELTSTRRQGPRPWDMWWCRSPPPQGGEVQSYSLRGSM
jgi:hypothetical protein